MRADPIDRPDALRKIAKVADVDHETLVRLVEGSGFRLGDAVFYLAVQKPAPTAQALQARVIATFGDDTFVPWFESHVLHTV